MNTRELYNAAYSYGRHHWVHGNILNLGWKFPNTPRWILERAAESIRNRRSFDHLGNSYRQSVRFWDDPIIFESSREHTRKYIALLKTRRTNRRNHVQSR